MLKSNALLTVDELCSSINLSREDIKSACIKIYNPSAGATSATVSKSDNILNVTVIGGANAHNTNFDLTNVLYDTIGELITAIEALSKGWVINRLCSSSFNSADLYNIPATSVLLSTLELTLNGFNSLALEEIINSASAYIENYCNRKFVSTAYTEYYDGNNRSKLLLNQYPIISVTSIDRWEYLTQASIQTYTEHTDFEIYSDEGIIYKSMGWFKGHKAYKIVYTAGYATAAMPEDLKQGCKEICKLLWILKDKQGLKGDNDGVRNTNYDKDLGVGIPKNVLEMLERYKKCDYTD